jgi:hypothetical protein
LKIGRNRRRINSRLRAVGREGRRLLSWRTHVSRFSLEACKQSAERHPAFALLTAFGLGAAASGDGKRGRFLRTLGLKWLRHAGKKAGQDWWREFVRTWSRSGAEK